MSLIPLHLRRFLMPYAQTFFQRLWQSTGPVIRQVSPFIGIRSKVEEAVSVVCEYSAILVQLDAVEMCRRTQTDLSTTGLDEGVCVIER